MTKSDDELQTIYINMDDSGKLNKNEDVCVYAGVVFFSKEEKDEFITKYRDIVKNIKCSYCKKTPCNNSCPELKHNNLSQKDKRRFLGFVKKYYVIGCVINNEKVYDNIMESKAAKGRFTDYVIRKTIISFFRKMIKTGKINPHKPVKLIINMDEQSTKSNGYYSLGEGIKEELKYGISNYNYFFPPRPILFSDFELQLLYRHSDQSYVIQAADLIAGSIRGTKIRFFDDPDKLMQSLTTFVDHIEFMP